MKICFPLLSLACVLSFTALGQTTPEKPHFSEAEQAQIDRERTPDLAKFNELLAVADRVVVINESEGKETKLFESSKPSDLRDLRNVLKVKLAEEWRDSICTSPSVVLFKGDRRLMSVGNVLGREVRTSLWSGNVLIENPEKWLEWFDARGMSQVRAERDREDESARKHDADEKRWRNTMPRGIEAQFEKQEQSFGLPSMGNVDGFMPILEREYPDKNKRIRAVLHWYGSGSGPWNGYASYESIAEDILFAFSTREILDAIATRRLSDTETEGAARLFAGWDYFKQRPDDIKMIPTGLKRQLLDHALKSADKEKREIAIAAFAAKK